jgi:hypothetical protein
VLVCWTGDSVAGLDPVTGKVYWQHPTKPAKMVINVPTPVVSGERLYLTAFYDGSYLFRLRQDQPQVELLWHRRGASETEMKERKARIEDALHATRAAIEEGIVPGGGVALIRCIGAVEGLKLTGDEKTGAEIVAKALTMPCYWIAANAGATANLVVSKVAEGKGALGYNADTDTYEDLIKAGVIDPLKVTRIALQNAVSIAGLLLTTDCVVTEKPKEKGAGHQHPGMGGGMGGMGGMEDYGEM